MLACPGEQGKRAGARKTGGQGLRPPFAPAGAMRGAYCALRFRPRGRSGSPLPERLACGDLDAEAREADVMVLGRSQQANRGNAEVPEDLRAEADFAPLALTCGLRPAAVFRRRGY